MGGYADTRDYSGAVRSSGRDGLQLGGRQHAVRPTQLGGMKRSSAAV